jgi:hypothetical protein
VVSESDDTAPERGPVNKSEARLAMAMLAEGFGLDRNPRDMVKTAQEIATEAQALQERLASVEQQLEQFEDLTDTTSSKTEKLAAIVQFAENKATHRMDKVSVSASEIIGATGVTRRYAYDLIGELPEEYDCFDNRTTISQYGSLENDQDSQTRALIVDCEAVHSDATGVNKFTTRTTGKEAQK